MELAVRELAHAYDACVDARTMVQIRSLICECLDLSHEDAVKAENVVRSERGMCPIREITDEP